MDDAQRGPGGLDFQVLASDTVAGFADGVLGQPVARFAAPVGVAFTSRGTWVIDRDAHRLRLLDTGGAVLTVAGGEAGWADGDLDQALFEAPVALASARGGDLLVVGEAAGGRVRQIQTTRRVDNQYGQVIETTVVTTLDFDAQAPIRPTAVAATEAGDAIVADAAGGRVLRHRADGTVDLLLDGLSAPAGVALDAAGNLYVSDTARHVIRLWREGVWSVFAGREDAPGDADGHRSGAARLNGPAALAMAADGRLAVSEPGQGRLRWISPDGVVSTWQPPAAADAPSALVFDDEGALRFSTASSRSLMRLAVDGTLARLAGQPEGTAAAVDGTARPPRVNRPLGLAFERDTLRLWVADAGNHAIRRLELIGSQRSDARLYTEAGTGQAGSTGGPPLQATMSSPSSVVWGGGRMFVADTDNHCIRMLDFDGVLKTIAGRCGEPGDADGEGALTRLRRPTGLVSDGGGGTIVVADTGNHRIRQLQSTFYQSSDFVLRTLAGSGVAGFADGPGTTARFNAPEAVAYHAIDGSVLVADTGNHRIRRILQDLSVQTVAGDGMPGTSQGPALQARFNGPRGVVTDDFGRIVVADTGNNLVRLIDTDGTVLRLSGVPPPYRRERPTVDESPLDVPVGLGLTSDGRVVVTNAGSNRIVSFRFP